MAVCVLILSYCVKINNDLLFFDILHCPPYEFSISRGYWIAKFDIAYVADPKKGLKVLSTFHTWKIYL